MRDAGIEGDGGVECEVLGMGDGRFVGAGWVVDEVGWAERFEGGAFVAGLEGGAVDG